MNGLSDERPAGHASVRWLAAAAALILTAALQIHGPILTPDGWAYWQGSVALLQGRGYAYFTGEPMTSWPPGLSILLAIAQAGLGISGATISITLIITATAAAWVWTRLLDRAWPRADVPIPWRICGALIIGTGLALWSRALTAHPLATLLLGGAASVVEARRTPAWPPRIAGALMAAALPMVHASMLVALPGLWLWAAVRSGSRWPRALLQAGWVPIGVLLGTAMLMASGTIGSHSSVTAAPAPLTTIVVQAATGLRELFVPAAHGFGALALVAIAAIVVGVAREDSWWRAPLLLAGTSVMLLVGLFSVTWVNDALGGRFLLFTWPLLVGMLVRAAAVRPGAVRGLAMTTLLLVGGTQMIRTVDWIRLPGPTAYPDRASWSTTIDAGYVTGPATRRGRLLLVAPPIYPWQRQP